MDIIDEGCIVEISLGDRSTLRVSGLCAHTLRQYGKFNPELLEGREGEVTSLVVDFLDAQYALQKVIYQITRLDDDDEELLN